MGYESRVMLVNRFANPSDPESIFGVIFSDFQLGKMKDFPDIFKHEIDFELVGDNDTNLTKDTYGEHCKSCDIETAIDYLSRNINSDPFYRYDYKSKAFLSYLKAFQENTTKVVEEFPSKKFGEWLLVHYGY